MKKFFTKSNFWSGFIGLFIGIAASMALFSALVPSGAEMIRIYHLEKRSQANALTGDITVNGTSTANNPSAPTRTTGSGSYVTNKITTEKQFVEAMKLHHESAVLMANQALALSLHPEVKTLVKNIISTQTTEIKMMKDWLAAWWK